MTKQIQKPVERSVLYLMRKLRKLLPGKVTKGSTAEFIVDDAVRVCLNYYCKWNPDGKKKSEKECFPHSIVVKSMDSYSLKFQAFRMRTFNKLKSGDFNYEGIMVAVTQALEIIEQNKIEKEHQEKAKLEEKKVREAEIQKLGKLLPKSFTKGYGNNYSCTKRNSQGVQTLEAEVNINNYGKKGEGVAYSLNFYGIKQEQLTKLIDAAGLNE